MTHEWIDLALGLTVSGVCGLVLRFLNHLDALEKSVGDKADKDKVEQLDRHTNQHSEEIRDTRSAIARIEGKLNLPPFPYTRSPD